jgi:hypothetical protein
VTSPVRDWSTWLRDNVRPRLKSSTVLQTINRRRKLVTERPRLVSNPSELHVAPDGPSQRVLLGTNIGGYLNGLTMEALLAAALRTRGHDVHVLLCDSVLPACMDCTITRLGTPERMAKSGPRRLLCPGCFEAGRRTYEEIGATVHSYSSLLTPEDHEEASQLAGASTLDGVAALTLDGLAIGEHALAGTLRFFARATLDGEDQALAVLRRYVQAAVLTARATTSLMRTHEFDVATFHHGIYVPQGIVGEVARHEGVRVVNWNPAYRARTFIFSHGDTYHHTLLTEPNEVWEALGWDEDRENAILGYLKSRWTGTHDWIWFHEPPEADTREIERATGVDFSKPCIGLLTNVMWDAQLHYPANAFATMLDWIIDTVRWFADHPELQLLIRVHPAEITGSVPSRQRVVEELRLRFPELPANVFVIPPESDLSTYAAMLECDSVIIYGTKTGVELSAVGLPVIVAGEAWIRGKGVSIDVSSVEEYHDVLGQLPLGKRLDEATTRRARQYAYHFFFRRMIPLEFMEPTGRDPVFVCKLEDPAQLLPGRSLGLDVVLDGILHGSPFIYPADKGHAAGAG